MKRYSLLPLLILLNIAGWAVSGLTKGKIMFCVNGVEELK